MNTRPPFNLPSNLSHPAHNISGIGPPAMAYTQPTYAPVAPPSGSMYSMGGMPVGAQNMQYPMLTGQPPATGAGPLGSGPGVGPVGVGVGRGGTMPMSMAINGQPQQQQVPGAGGMQLRYAVQNMGLARGMVATPIGRGMGMSGGPVMMSGMPGVTIYGPAGIPLPPGTRLIANPAGGVSMTGRPPGPGGYVINSHGQPMFAGMAPSQQQLPNPNIQGGGPGGPGGPGQPSAHMLIPQQTGGAPQQQQAPPGGPPGMSHPVQKMYQQQGPFMNTIPMLPPSSGSPVRNPSPNAGTPASAPTPGGQGAGRAMAKPPTPANAGTPYPPNASTPGGRPGTASGQPPNTSGYQQGTPRMQHADASGGVQSSPGAMQRNPQQQQPGAPIGAMSMQSQQQQQPVAQQQPGGPVAPDHSFIFRSTPAQMENKRNMEMYGTMPAGQGGGAPGSNQQQGQGPMDGIRYTTMPMGHQQQQHAGGGGGGGGGPQGLVQQRTTGPPPPQGMMGQMSHPQMQPLQPQHTGGSIGPLQPQHTGGSMASLQPQLTGGAVPRQQHTGGSMSMQGMQVQDAPGNPPGPGGPTGPVNSGPGGRTSVPSTPQMSRQASVNLVHSGMTMGPMPMAGMQGMQGMPPGMQGYAMPGMPGLPAGPGEMRPPAAVSHHLPLSSAPHARAGEGFRALPMGLSDVTMASMGPGGMIGTGSARHAFGVLRLLQFSKQLKGISGFDEDKWLPIIAEHFTDTATFTIRAQKGLDKPANTFVRLPFSLLVRFFASLSQSHINRMSLVLDGAMESQVGQEYTVFCPAARWPMYYDNGYVLELNGILKARCRTVPIQLPTTEQSNSATSGPPNVTPRMSSAVPGNATTNGMDSSPSSSNNMNASPTNPPTAATANSDMKSYMPNSPYMVKIEDLEFDSVSVEKLVSITAAGGKYPKEPENVHGIPMMTLRVIEFSEGMQALEPLVDHLGSMETTDSPMEAFKAYASYLQKTYGEQPIKPEHEAHMAGLFAKRKRALAMSIPGTYIGTAETNPPLSPPLSVLSANVATRIGSLVEHGAPGPSSDTDPSVSPSIAPKTPGGKKNVAPGSPTKAAANNAAEKEKGGGKRKSTTDEGPPTKRRTTRKGSKLT